MDGHQWNHHPKVPKQLVVDGNMLSKWFENALKHYFVCMGATGQDDTSPKQPCFLNKKKAKPQKKSSNITKMFPIFHGQITRNIPKIKEHGR